MLRQKKNLVLELTQENLIEFLSIMYLPYIYWAVSLYYTKLSLF